MCKEIVKNIKEKFEPLRKSSWIPIVENKDGNLIDSKFSGVPFLKKEEEWPSCKRCGKPMHFFLQLNVKNLPEEMKKDLQLESGLIQMFYCTDWDENCDDWEPFSKSTLVRLLSEEELSEGKNEVVIPNEIKDDFPAKKIVGWEEKKDYPMLDEIDELEMDVSLTEEEEELYYECYEEEDFPVTLQGDKLGGYPFWVQHVEYPNCPECNERMRFVFQLDSEVNLPYMFGDSGIGHITQCPNHPHILTFSWACY